MRPQASRSGCSRSTKRRFGPESPDAGRALNNLANSYADLGRNAQALDLYRRSLTAMERKFGEGSGPTALAAGSLGQALMDAGRMDEARPYLVRCLEIDDACSAERIRSSSRTCAASRFSTSRPAT